MRASSLALLLTIFLAGCGAKSQTVYIDVARVLKATEARPPDKPAAPKPPKPQPGYSASLPGKPASVVLDRPKSSGVDIRRTIAAAQAKALRDIQSRLRRFYDTEVARFELDQQKLLTEAELKAYEEANVRIRAEFEEYGRRRGPIFAELTLLAGFPDPNPASKPPDDKLPAIMQRRFERTVELREQLKALDLEFDHTVQLILGGVRDVAAATLASMRLRVEQFKTDLDRKAQEEAEAQVRSSASELGLKLIDPLNITLPATPASAVSIPAEKPFRPAPEVPSLAILQGQKDRERLIRHELEIWTGLNRYVLTSNAAADDKTDEFLKWRQKFEVGR
jgi:hypothetical protein